VCTQPSSMPPSPPCDESAGSFGPADDQTGLAGRRDDLRGRHRHRQRLLRDQRAELLRVGRESPLRPPPGRSGSRRNVVGWAALAPVSDRCVYAGVAENSVYVHPEHHGRGVGRHLLEALIGRAEAADIWTVHTSIFPRTPRASPFISAAGSVPSADENGSASSPGSGGTRSSLSSAAASQG
jgi:GNAT superfamily N-acetyltransferase